jgi:hypothetical protein
LNIQGQPVTCRVIQHLRGRATELQATLTSMFRTDRAGLLDDSQRRSHLPKAYFAGLWTSLIGSFLYLRYQLKGEDTHNRALEESRSPLGIDHQ